MVLVDGKILVVVDDVAAEGRPDLEWRLQSRFEVQVRGNVATIEGRDNVLHVVSVAPLEAIVGVGKATLNYVSIKPRAAQPAQVFVTVLYPGPAGMKPPQAALQAQGTDSVLTVSGTNGNAVLEFRRGATWQLTRIGSEIWGINGVGSHFGSK
jgi:hypothetical protein